MARTRPPALEVAIAEVELLVGHRWDERRLGRLDRWLHLLAAEKPDDCDLCSFLLAEVQPDLRRLPLMRWDQAGSLAGKPSSISRRR